MVTGYVLFCEDVDENSEDFITEFYQINSYEVEIRLCKECSEFPLEKKVDLALKIINEFNDYNYNEKRPIDSLEKNL